jgi:hypothetical protein
MKSLVTPPRADALYCTHASTSTKVLLIPKAQNCSPSAKRKLKFFPVKDTSCSAIEMQVWGSRCLARRRAQVGSQPSWGRVRRSGRMAETIVLPAPVARGDCRKAGTLRALAASLDEQDGVAERNRLRCGGTKGRRTLDRRQSSRIWDKRPGKALGTFNSKSPIPNSTENMRIEFMAPEEFRREKDFRIDVDKGVHARLPDGIPV